MDYSAFEDLQPAKSLSSWTFDQENGDMNRRLEVRRFQDPVSFLMGAVCIRQEAGAGEWFLSISEAGFDANLA